MAILKCDRGVENFCFSICGMKFVQQQIFYLKTIGVSKMHHLKCIFLVHAVEIGGLILL